MIMTRGTLDSLVWMVPLAYVAVSLILLFFPTLVHKKKLSHFKAFNISHRGGSGEAVENTLSAFENSFNCGVHMFELDVHLTRDRRVVVMHDKDLSRTTASNALVQNTNYKDFPLYNHDIPLTFTKSGAVMRTDEESDRRIPLLSEVFQLYPGVPINIDIKCNSDELIRSVSELVKENGREKITVWGSFSETIAKKCYKENPNIIIMCSLWRVVCVTVFFYLGILPFTTINEAYFEIPLLDADSIKSAILPKGILPRYIFKIATCLLTNRLLFRHLRARGIKVFLWVLNEEDEFDRAVWLGVDGIMTDYPSKLNRYLTRNSAHLNSQPISDKLAPNPSHFDNKSLLTATTEDDLSHSRKVLHEGNGEAAKDDYGEVAMETDVIVAREAENMNTDDDDTDDDDDDYDDESDYDDYMLIDVREKALKHQLHSKLDSKVCFSKRLSSS